MDRFRFQNAELQLILRRLYEAAGIPHAVAEDGALACDETFGPAVEALRSDVRARRFGDWHALCVLDDPAHDDGEFRRAALASLAERAVPFEIEERGEECWLLLPEDEGLPDSLLESVYGPAGVPERTNPPCCFCRAGIEDESFGEISVRTAEGAFRSVLYAHLDCLRERTCPEARHVLGTAD